MMVHPRRITVNRRVPVWVITFGDMMALLLCFFILLQMFSELKKDREYQRVVTAIKEAFGYSGSIGVLPVDDAPLTSTIEVLENLALAADRGRGGAGRPADDGVDGARTRVRSIRDAVVFSIGGAATFEPMSAEVNAPLRAELEKLAIMLGGRNNKIEIIGHAAAKYLPEGGPWRNLDELSYRRAENVRDVLVACGLDERAFRLTAAGTHEPVQSRAWTVEEGADNRRVEIVLTDVLVDELIDDALFTDDAAARGG